MNKDLEQLLELKVKISYVLGYISGIRKKYDASKCEYEKNNEIATSKFIPEKSKEYLKIESYNNDIDRQIENLNWELSSARNDNYERPFVGKLAYFLNMCFIVIGFIVFLFIKDRLFHMNTWKVNMGDFNIFDFIFNHSKFLNDWETAKWALLKNIGIFIGKVLIAVVFSFLFGLIPVPLYFLGYKKTDYEKIRNKIKLLRKQKRINNVPEYIPANQDPRYEGYKNKVAKAKNECVKYKEKMKVHADEVKKIVSSFEKRKYIIDKSDFMYVDYLIYLFETGRAESIKEALILLDQERRHDEMMKSLNQISKNINRSLENISNQLNRIGDRIVSSISSLELKVIESTDMINNSIFNSTNLLQNSLENISDSIYENTKTSNSNSKKILKCQEEIKKHIIEGNKIGTRQYETLRSIGGYY